MALTTIRSRHSLTAISVLAPERYDPRRSLHAATHDSIRLGDIARIERKVIQPSPEHGQCLVLDTSDAREGIIIVRKTPVNGAEIGSAKKIAAPHDVIISRLRPYLRQVAFVDPEIPNTASSLLACSTEFFVLRSRDEQSIAFLVPFLLAPQVQQVLAAAQEGGHHPRFGEEILMMLPLPARVLRLRNKWSQVVQNSVRLYRQSEREIAGLVNKTATILPV